MSTLPVPVASTTRLPRLRTMPVFYGNPTLSLFAVMLFPDDVTLARKLVARLLSHGTLQSTLAAGVQIDNQYLTAILDDLKGGQPEPKLVARRHYWASACGQIVKVLFALTNSPDQQVREFASWEQAIKLAEREIGRMVRGNRSSLHVQLRRFQPALHIAGAYEMAREETVRPPMTADGLMLNAMVLFQKLWAWHCRRTFRGSRNDYLDGEVFWRWEGTAYDDHGVADLQLTFENLVPHGKSGRPRKHR